MAGTEAVFSSSPALIFGQYRIMRRQLPPGLTPPRATPLRLTAVVGMLKVRVDGTKEKTPFKTCRAEFIPSSSRHGLVSSGLRPRRNSSEVKMNKLFVLFLAACMGALGFAL